MSSWKLKAYDYHRYNDQSAWDFTKQHSDSQVLRAFESSAHPTLRADLIRLAVLSVKGGVWGDAHDRCCGSLEAMTGNGYDLGYFKRTLARLAITSSLLHLIILLFNTL